MTLKYFSNIPYHPGFYVADETDNASSFYSPHPAEFVPPWKVLGRLFQLMKDWFDRLKFGLSAFLYPVTISWPLFIYLYIIFINVLKICKENNG